MIQRFFIIILFFFCFGLAVNSQTEIIKSNEQKLHNLFASLNKGKIQLNDSIENLLQETLNLQGAIEYPFDSLKYVGKIISDDRKVRIFTWNIVLPNGDSKFFGFILHKSDNKTRLHKVSEADSLYADIPKLVLDNKHWPGYLIYDIIDIKISGETCYTLLTYDPGDLFVKRKIVDILWFKEDLPVFGMPVFKYRNQIQNRIIFEFSAKAQMGLTYNSEKKMIIFDHLVLSDQSFAGSSRYYFPDLSFDGLKFEKGFWQHLENIDVRN